MTKKKPLIGVTTSARRGRFMWWCTWLGIILAGGKAIRITALNNVDHKECNGYIISGGVDINPKCYGQKNTASIDIEPERDALEKRVLAHAFEYKKPILGICRGAQMINITKGGTLHQDARNFYEKFVPANSILGKIFSRHLIHIVKDGLFSDLFKGRSELYVNSLHHQAIYKLGNQLKIVAEDDHGIVQAIESSKSNDIFILGVQWHPEFMPHSAFHRKLFEALVRQANK